MSIIAHDTTRTRALEPSQRDPGVELAGGSAYTGP